MSATIAADVFVAESATIVGVVRMAPGSSVWFAATVDGEHAPVEIGERSNVQDNCVVRGTPGHPVVIGADVTVGHNATILGAVVESDALIAIGATLHQGAHIGTGSIVAANAVVPEGTHVPPNSLVIGQGHIPRQVRDTERGRIAYGANEYARLAQEYLSAR